MPLTWVAALAALALGATAGSFANVAMVRYGTAETLRGRSHCPRCRRQLSWRELVPLFSFIVQGGRCRACHRPISVRYPAVELAVALAFAAVFIPVPVTAGAWAEAALAAAAIVILVILAGIDQRTMVLPDVYIGSLTVVALAAAAFAPRTLASSVAGAAGGAGFLAAVWLVSRIITRREGIGLGDIKLMVPLGVLFGPAGTAALLYLAFTAGGLVGIFLLATRRATLKTALPFGPYLAGVAIVLLLFPGLPEYLVRLILG